MPGPLDGLRVIDITQGLSGPYCSMLLGDAGADVVKVEPPEGDYARGYAPATASGDAAQFIELNRNKRSVVLDLERPEGMEALRGLLREADVLLTDLSPARAAALHLDYPSVEAVNRRLVQCNITPFGEHGPMAEQPGAEVVIQGMAEYTQSLGQIGSPPVRLGTDVANVNTGQQAVQGIMAALLMRERTGEGQLVTVNMLNTLLHLRGMMWASHSESVDDWWGFHQDTYVKPADHGYRTKDGYVFIARMGAVTDEQFDDLLTTLGIPLSVKDDPKWAGAGSNVLSGGSRYGWEYTHVWEEAFKDRTTDEVISIFEQHGLNGFPVNDYEALTAEPQLDEIGMLQTLTHPEIGEYQTLGVPWLFKDTPASVRTPAPTLGQHTDEVLAEAGLGADAVRSLREAGVTR
ncbi:MAG: CoA transferase [Dehalococcoidia bacterium]